jgi:hypothetical protein
VVNTATTIVTFLMVFLIQNSQNRDGAAMQAKLDELIRAIEEARGTFIGIEHLTVKQIAEIRKALEDDCAKEPARYKGNNETVRTSVDRLLSAIRSLSYGADRNRPRVRAGRGLPARLYRVVRSLWYVARSWSISSAEKGGAVSSKLVQPVWR